MNDETKKDTEPITEIFDLKPSVIGNTGQSAVESANARNKEYEYILDGQIFKWDTDKSDINKKHDISFEEAATVFRDTRTIYIEDDIHSIGEERFIAIGMSAAFRVLFVCHCMRETNTVIRIISARKATKIEKQAWEEENYEI